MESQLSVHDEEAARILVVDDRPENLYAMKMLLKDLDAQTYTADSGMDALALMLHHDFAVVLLDVQMPEMDGFELASLMRSNYKTRNIPIIFLTALSREVKHIFKGYESGAVDYILKPFEPEILLSKVRIFCRLYRQQKELILEVERRRKTEEENLLLIAEIQDALAEREASNVALAQTKSRLSLIMESMQAAVLVVDAQSHVITEVNPTMANMLKLSCENIIGEICCTFLCPVHQTHCPACNLAHMEQSTEGVLHDANGRDVYVLRTAVSVMIGDRPHYVANFIDISELKRLQQEMLQAQKLEGLGVLAGGIAHDFNNLLMGILGYAELALLECDAGTKLRRDVERIQTSAQRAAELTKLMLAYSGRGSFDVHPQDLSKLVEEMTSLLEVAASKNVTLIRNFATDIPAVVADATQLRQIVMNLITNASEAIGERAGKVTISTGVVMCDEEYFHRAAPSPRLNPGVYVYLDVEDNGCGMSRETLDRIFDPFFTTKFTGRGLGLSAMQGIVRGHGGGIVVTSELGQGTTFRVLLPPSDKPAVAPSDRRIRMGDWKGSGTILIVDDEENVREPTKFMLSRFGFTVLTAEDGLQALEIFRNRSLEINCVLLDMTMPRLSGLETFRMMREIRNDIPVVLTSGFSAEDAFQKFQEPGLAGFLQKPYRLKELRSRLEEIFT